MGEGADGGGYWWRKCGRDINLAVARVRVYPDPQGLDSATVRQCPSQDRVNEGLQAKSS